MKILGQNKKHCKCSESGKDYIYIKVPKSCSKWMGDKNMFYEGTLSKLMVTRIINNLCAEVGIELRLSEIFYSNENEPEK